MAVHSSFREEVEAFQGYANEAGFPKDVWRSITVKGREDREGLMDCVAEIPANFPDDQAAEIQAETIDAMFYHTDLLEEIVPDWMNRHKDHPMYDRIVPRYATSVAVHDESAAQEWIDTMQDGDLRARARDAVRKIETGIQE